MSRFIEVIGRRCKVGSLRTEQEATRSNSVTHRRTSTSPSRSRTTTSKAFCHPSTRMACRSIRPTLLGCRPSFSTAQRSPTRQRDPSVNVVTCALCTSPRRGYRVSFGGGVAPLRARRLTRQSRRSPLSRYHHGVMSPAVERESYELSRRAGYPTPKLLRGLGERRGCGRRVRACDGNFAVTGCVVSFEGS